MAVDQVRGILHSERLSISQFRENHLAKRDVYDRLNGVGKDRQNLVTTCSMGSLYIDYRDAFALLAVITILDPKTIEHCTLKPRPRSQHSDGYPISVQQYVT